MNKRRFYLLRSAKCLETVCYENILLLLRVFDLELHGLNDFLQQGDGIHTFEVLFVLDQRPYI